MNPMKTITFFFELLVLLLVYPVITKAQETMPADITIDRDGILLKGKFFFSDGSGPFPTVVLLHGFPGNESDVLGIGNKLAHAGINALTFNYSGTYQSQGQVSWDNMQLDIHAAFKFLLLSNNTTQFKVDTNKIYGYSAWNTTGNTLGSVISTGMSRFIAEKSESFELNKLIR